MLTRTRFISQWPLGFPIATVSTFKLPPPPPTSSSSSMMDWLRPKMVSDRLNWERGDVIGRGWRVDILRATGVNWLGAFEVRWWPLVRLWHQIEWASSPGSPQVDTRHGHSSFESTCTSSNASSKQIINQENLRNEEFPILSLILVLCSRISIIHSINEWNDWHLFFTKDEESAGRWRQRRRPRKNLSASPKRRDTINKYGDANKKESEIERRVECQMKKSETKNPKRKEKKKKSEWDKLGRGRADRMLCNHRLVNYQSFSLCYVHGGVAMGAHREWLSIS